MYGLILPLVVIVAAGVIHEGGHYLAALFLTGEKLRFRFSVGWLCYGKLPVPRFIWTMPLESSPAKLGWTPDVWRRRVIALSGFGLELLVSLVLMAVDPGSTFSRAYTLAALAHLALYKFYAGEASDFKWL